MMIPFRIYEAMAIAPVGLTSLRVSGSVVVVGNTVHWVEKQGRCDQSTTRKTVRMLIESTHSMGGRVIESADEMGA